MSKSPNLHVDDWREQRRIRAWELHQRGWLQVQIAKELGVTQSAVSRWFKQVSESGNLDGLHRHPAPGKRALLTSEQFAQIPDLIDQGAEAFGFQGNQWTSKRVAIALKQVFDVSYHPGHVSKLLQKYCPDWRHRNKA